MQVEVDDAQAEVGRMQGQVGLSVAAGLESLELRPGR